MFCRRNNRLLRAWMVMVPLGLALLSCNLTAPRPQPADTQTPPTAPSTPTLPATLPVQEPSPASRPAELLAPGDPSQALLPAARQDLSSLAQATRYILALDIDPSLRRFEGRAQVEVTNQEDVPLQSLYFRLLPNGQKSYGDGSLTLSEVRVNGQPALSQLSAQDTVLEIPLPASLPPGQRVDLTMVFAGQVPLDFGSGVAGYGIYNLDLNQVVLSLSGWYPILAVYDHQGWNLDPVSEIGDSVYSDTAFYSVRVCAPASLVVASTGSRVDQQASGDRVCARLESGPTRDFYLVASPNFNLVSQQVDGVMVNSYSLPGHEQASQLALNIARDSLRIYNQKFGAYPFTEMDVVEAPMRNALGVEYPGIMLVGSTLYDQPGEPEFSVTIAHEVAHQWWYSVVGNDVFDSPWLDEGLTTYSSSLYYEYGSSPEFARGLLAYWQQRYERLEEEGKDDQIVQSLAHFESLGDPSIYSGVVYTKGALFFHALRQEIGDTAFFDALQQYYQARKYAIAQPADLLAAFEAAAGRSLEAFYASWLYTPEN